MRPVPNSADAARRFRTMSRLQWLTTLATVVGTVGGVAATSIEIRFDGYNPALLYGGVLAIVAVVYTYIRVDLKLAAVSDAVAQLSIFIPIAGMLSYAAAAIGAWSPFWDDRLMAADFALGFDWRAYLAFVASHPTLAAVLNAAYLSFLWQAFGLVTILVFIGQSMRLQRFVFAFQISCLLCIVGSALMPALGTYPYLHINGDIDHPGIALASMNVYVPTLMQLRGPAPFIPTGDMHGIVTFPSMHMAAAVLFIWGFWRVPVLRWLALGLNLVMIAATPLSGGHYLVDLLAGALVAIVSLAAAASAARLAARHPVRGRAEPIADEARG